jgi:hypothetical protein
LLLFKEDSEENEENAINILGNLATNDQNTLMVEHKSKFAMSLLIKEKKNVTLNKKDEL